MWTEVNASAPGGLAQWRQSAVLVDGKIWVFGGQDGVGSVVGGVFCFDIGTCPPSKPSPPIAQTWIASNTWRAGNSTGPQRSGHTAVLTIDSTAMLVFGGHDGEQFCQDTWSFHFGAHYSFLGIRHGPSLSQYQGRKGGSLSLSKLPHLDGEAIPRACGGILQGEDISLSQEEWTSLGRRTMSGCRIWVRHTPNLLGTLIANS